MQKPSVLESSLGLKSRHDSLLAMPYFKMVKPLGFTFGAFIMLNTEITSAHGGCENKGVYIYRVDRIIPDT